MLRKYTIITLIIGLLSIPAFAQQNAWFDLNKHYKSGLELLESGKFAAASNQFNNVTILDAGTHYGWSAYALKQNPTNKIITYDITDKFENKYLNNVANIEVKILDVNQESVDIIHSAEVIYLDIDPHDGIQEKVFTDMLHRIEWQGYLFCDDIHINGGMENWWNSILLDKYDLTEIGHLHGTGLITFNRKVSIIK